MKFYWWIAGNLVKVERLLAGLNNFPVGRVPSGDPEARPGDSSDECEDEDPGRATSGLSETHRCSEGILVCEGGALQHASG